VPTCVAAWGVAAKEGSFMHNRKSSINGKKKKKAFRDKPAYNVSLAAMFAAFSVIFLYLAGILPTGRVTMYFLSSLFAAGMVIERQTLLAFAVYAATSLLGLLILPDRLSVLPYVLLFGHYGIGKLWLESNVRDKITAFLLKLVYFDI
jgi:hypothetical protein